MHYETRILPHIYKQKQNKTNERETTSRKWWREIRTKKMAESGAGDKQNLDLNFVKTNLTRGEKHPLLQVVSKYSEYRV